MDVSVRMKGSRADTQTHCRSFGYHASALQINVRAPQTLQEVCDSGFFTSWSLTVSVCRLLLDEMMLRPSKRRKAERSCRFSCRLPGGLSLRLPRSQSHFKLDVNCIYSYSEMFIQFVLLSAGTVRNWTSCPCVHCF